MDTESESDPERELASGTRVDGWRLKFGRVAPTVVGYPNDVSRLLPEGAKVVAVTAGATSFDAESMAGARERRRAAVRRLDEWGVDCVVAAGGPVATLEGSEAEASFVDEMRAETGVPFATSLGAQVDALEALGARSLLAVTPFPPERDAEMRAFLEDRGFDVVAVGGPKFAEPGATRDLPRSASYRHARALAAAVEEEFDAVYVACTPFGSVDHIAAIEADLGVPAVFSAQAQVWKACRMAGVSPDIEGYGRLFETV